MIWRLLFILLKSALAVTLFELFAPVADAIGLHLTWVATAAGTISHFTALPYNEAEILILFVLATATLEVGNYVWDLMIG